MIQTQKLMGGDVSIDVDCDSKSQTTEILNYSFEVMRDLINIFNFYDKNSLLSKLNDTREIDYNEELAFLIEKGIWFYEYSKGYFDIFLGNENLARKSNKSVSENSLKKKKQLKNIVTITKSTIKINDFQIKIDLGGIAKGYIVDRTIELTREKYKKVKFDIFVNARGDMRIDGKSDVAIGVENPFNDKGIVEVINLKKGSIVTSGHNKQYFESGSHIVGKEDEILTATIVSNKLKCYELDALGTYLSQLNGHNVLDLVEFDDYLQNVEVLLILKNQRILKSGFFDMFTK